MASTVTKAQIIERIAENKSISKTEAASIYKSVMDVVEDALVMAEKVQLPIGIFTKKHKASRNGRNPKTGESIVIPAKTTIGFKQSKFISEHI